MGDRASRPAQRAGLVGLPLDDDLVLCAPDGGRAYVLNGTAAQVWALCDGTRTVEEIARDLAAAYEIEYQRALGDVRGFLADLQRTGLVS